MTRHTDTHRTHRPLYSFLAYGILGAAACTTFFVPHLLTIPATVAAPGDTVELAGVVRDFKRAHVDFDTTPAEGTGHSAGNVVFGLGSDGRPVFNTGSDGNGPLDNRIAHWKLDEGGGGTASDDVGTNHGTLVSGPTWTAGKDGGALHFDGVDDYVNIPSAPETQVSGDVTFAGWFRLDTDFDASSPDTMVIMEKFLDTEHDFHIGLAGGDYNRPEVPKGTLVFKVENGPTSDYYRYVWSQKSSWTAGVWYHFAAVLVSSDTAQNGILINGVDDTDPINAGGVGFVDTDYDAPMRFGGRTVDYNGLATDIYFKGAIDDVIIFDRALTQEDMTPSAGGFKVASQWEDAAMNPIAPHLFANGRYLGVRVDGNAILDRGFIDSFDSSLGEYGESGNDGGDTVVSTNSTAAGAVLVASDFTVTGDVMVGVGGDPATVIDDSGTITGTTGALSTPVAMPVVLPPDDTVVGPNLGNGWYKDDPFEIATNLHFNDLRISNDAVVTVTGNVTILVEGSFSTETRGVLEVAPGASLDLYVVGDTTVETRSAWSNPANTRLWVVGSPEIKIQTDAAFHGSIIAPAAKLLVKTGADLYGSFTGREIELQTDAAIHVDLARTRDACGAVLFDTEGSFGVDSDGGITSVESFYQWFHDVPGVNQSARHSITLVKSGTGVWSYLDNAFYPIDGRLFGDETDAHNTHFTYALPARFTHDACASKFVEFEGGDGVWIFIDGRLVIDLGGVDPGEIQRVDLDRLGLTDGQDYTLDLFYAQRRLSSSEFRLRTNIQLRQAGGPTTVSAMFD